MTLLSFSLTWHDIDLKIFSWHDMTSNLMSGHVILYHDILWLCQCQENTDYYIYMFLILSVCFSGIFPLLWWYKLQYLQSLSPHLHEVVYIIYHKKNECTFSPTSNIYIFFFYFCSLSANCERTLYNLLLFHKRFNDFRIIRRQYEVCTYIYPVHNQRIFAAFPLWEKSTLFYSILGVHNQLFYSTFLPHAF
jgi:hypothetical protein